jgi:two-component system phosphate regulon sensor histidine kinase PhoR
MARRRTLWQLYPSYLLITILSVVALGWYSTSALRDFYLNNVIDDLESRAHLATSQLSGLIDRGEYARVDSLCDIMGAASSTRLTVILASGRVVGDSERNPDEMESHADRPEIAAAMSGETGTSTRYSTTLRTSLTYLAVPVIRHGEVVAVVRVSIPITFVELALKSVRNKIVIAGFAVACLSAIIGLLVASRISRPLEHLKRVADSYARGHLRRRIIVTGSEEVVSLAEAMNRMALDLDRRIQMITRQGRKYQAILASMSEGIIAIDTRERIIDMNDAAIEMLSLQNSQFKGRLIHELVRSRELQELAVDTLANGDTDLRSLTLRGPDERHVEGHGTILSDDDGNSIGALIVLNDITRIKKLETVRRDFVANVSHELKTPITSIKGYVETLLDGDLEDRSEVRKFLEITSKHADRLNSIIEDLLSLSRLELDAELAQMNMENLNLRGIMNAGVQACELQAASRNINVTLDCSEELTVRVHRRLFEQAIVNLVDNAVKYSEENSSVRVSAAQQGDQIEILVEDSGIGIEEEHLGRIFERFYRVNKVRSRDLGGTGLGLSIVKHTALVHGGSVEVDSRPGEGSTFRIMIPVG